MIVLLFGPPGCGKGTQAALIARRFHIPAISTGDIFRAECKAETDLGKQACAILHAGGLVDDALTNRIVAQRLAQPDCASGFLLDGYPRTLEQAGFLDAFINSLGLPKPAAIHLDAPDLVLVPRIAARRQCAACGRIYNLLSQPPRCAGLCDQDQGPLFRRDDDYEEVIRARLQAYRSATAPLIDYYRNVGYTRVVATQSPEAILEEISAVLERAAAADHLGAKVSNIA